MRGVRLKSMMAAVLAVALLVAAGMALQRRSARFVRLYRAESRNAARMVAAMGEARDPAAVEALVRRAHWHNAVASEYRKVASFPLELAHPDPTSVACQCSTCAGRLPLGWVGSGQK